MASYHTFGDSCMLKEESNTFTRRASSVAIDPPKITAQFFYSSALPIHDPLAAVPPPPSSTATRSVRVPPRPFSVHDNIALDQAWLKLQQPSKESVPHKKNLHKRVESFESELYTSSIPPKNKTGKADGDQKGKAGKGGNSKGGSSLDLAIHSPTSTENTDTVANGPQLVHSPEASPRGVDLTLCDDPDYPPLAETAPVTSEEIAQDEFKSGAPRTRRSRSFFRRKEKDEKPKEDMESPRISTRKLSRGRQEAHESPNLFGMSPDTTGTPFLRVPSRLRRTRSRSPDREVQTGQVDGAEAPGRDYRPKQSSPLRPMFPIFHSSHESQDEDDSSSDNGSGGRSFLRRQQKIRKNQVTHVTVGISRLHVVEMPSLKMGPIYWDPVHDVSSVVRGTWFYKDTMWPVESDLANQIEEGYEYMKPWTPTYVDEVNSCLEIGPEAELKVVHKIWPAEEARAAGSRPTTGKGKQPTSDELEQKEAKTVAGMAGNRAAGFLDGLELPGTGRLFARSSIIYANARDAQILKPSQLPSVSKGRRPLGHIRKGRSVGIPVVRGFDMKAWEKINPAPNQPVTSAQAIQAGTTKSLKRRKSCLACESANEQPKPTDLILVIHGIGQKLSERVESFHFTHAINAFRRHVNLELNADAVKPWLRQDLGGIMVLPINWRSTLKLQDGGPEPDPNRREGDPDPKKNEFTLKDITAESLPAVRNLISDVMLDIPYYLSHHKPKMIEAVVTEANRIYRLWTINNPGFHENGRVHLLAHSLGSIMALDILSKQPTKLPQQMDYHPRNGRIRTDVFEFDTKSLFFCGSPAGFFLLLNRASLVPRRGREKPEGEESGGVTGQTGTFGCLAVDNLYNVMHYNDPVAYRLNACVDVGYAAGLQSASVPPSSATWGQYIGSYFRGKAIPPAKTMTGLDELPRRPTTARLPTTVEMETHDFSREEIAEKRMFLLNDNGQIDYTLPSEGGPLEIQYLNMLGAHSSYWTRQDFVRFLVVEVGRKQGKTETLSSMRAVKKPFGKK